jgi:hypothetical protein
MQLLVCFPPDAVQPGSHYLKADVQMESLGALQAFRHLTSVDLHAFILPPGGAPQPVFWTFLRQTTKQTTKNIFNRSVTTIFVDAPPATPEQQQAAAAAQQQQQQGQMPKGAQHSEPVEDAAALHLLLGPGKGGALFHSGLLAPFSRVRAVSAVGLTHCLPAGDYLSHITSMELAGSEERARVGDMT